MLGPNEKEKRSRTDSLFGNVDPLLGKTMGGRWEVQEFLGEGSMSVVYKAQDLETSKPVVLKILHHHLVANAKSLKRFEQRAKATIDLNHERICKVMDIHLSPDGQVFLVVEPLKGESLEDLLAKTGHLSVDHAVEIFSQSCEALEYAHSEDVLHRDLKPSNIVLLESNAITDEVKLVDFGIARLLTEEGDDIKSSGYITRTREVFGSPMYMSPEQCMGKKLDARSDIYSIGCVMYETLTGKPPFVGKNVLETAYKHMNEAPKPMVTDTTSGRSLARLETVIFKCLAKDPNERYQLVSQLYQDLQMLLKANDTTWVNNAFALKKIAKAKKREGRKFVMSFEVGVFSGAAVLLFAVVSIWSFMFLGADSQDYPAFKNDKLFVVQERRQPPEVPDFGSQEEAYKMDADSARKEKGEKSRDYLNATWHLYELYKRAGHWSEAADQLGKFIEIAPTADPAVSIPAMYAKQALCYFEQNELDKASKTAMQSIEEFDKQGNSKDGHLNLAYTIVGDVYSQQNHLSEAVGIYDKAYQLADQRKLVAPMEYVQACSLLADIYRRQNKLQEADRLYKLAMDASTNYITDEKVSTQVFVSKAKYGYGLTLYAEGKYKDAETSFRESQQMCKSIPAPFGGEKSGLYGACKRMITECLWKTNPFGAISARFGNDPSK
jgi:serine/threonine protein kinase